LATSPFSPVVGSESFVLFVLVFGSATSELRTALAVEKAGPSYFYTIRFNGTF
jgi:hypothetical protein